MRLTTRFLFAAIALAGSATAAFAADKLAAPSETVFLLEVVVLVVAGRILAELMQRIGQPAVMGQLIAGILLGPSVLGALAPALQSTIFPTAHDQKGMIDAVGQLGVLLLLLLTGMETDLMLVRKVGRASITVSVAGIAVPFACGFALGELAPDWILPNTSLRLITALFLGTALSISSVKIVALVVRDLGFLRRNVGQIIVASAILDDTIGWIIVAIISSIALKGTVELGAVLPSIVGTALFLFLSFTLGRRVVFTLIRFANDHFVSEMPVITVIIAIMGGMALTTAWLGVHTVLGAFVAGILIGESPILTRHIDEELRGLITALFMPVFFGLAGLSADLSVLADPSLLLFTFALVVIASVGKFGGAFIGGRFGGLSNRECLALACGMNARGSTEVIVATIGLSIGALDQRLFTMILTMAVVTTLAMPPMLRWALARLPFTDEERERIERESFAERGFVTRLERLLLAVDESGNGTFASRLAGFIAGTRGLPTTVLPLKRTVTALTDGETPSADANAATVREAAEKAEPSDPQETPSVAVTKRAYATTTAKETIAAEAVKGYDLLMIGIANAVAPDGTISDDVTRIAEGFEGPIALVDARGTHVERPLDGSLRILVPVTGTEVSRRAAEIALSLARSTDSRVTALYVSARSGRRRRTRFERAIATRSTEEAILKEIVQLADQYGANIRTSLRADISAEEAILRHAHTGRHDLIVMGVSRRPGETMSFGNVAAEVLAKSKRSLLLVAS